LRNEKKFAGLLLPQTEVALLPIARNSDLQPGVVGPERLAGWMPIVRAQVRCGFQYKFEEWNWPGNSDMGVAADDGELRCG
jgi:hypothetical protein